ncbi:MAG: hypothetical protein ACYDEX_12535 [Mobilitalea sp.]
MKIESSSIVMSSISSLRKVSRTTEQLTAWVGNRPNEQNQVGKEQNTDFREKLKNLKNSIGYEALAQASHVEKYEEELMLMSDEDESKITLLNKLMDALIGKKIKFYIPKKIVLRQYPAPIIPSRLQFQNLQGQQNGQGAALKGWGLEYQKQEYYSESESMSFNSGGTVTTSDGKTIEFNVNLNLSRSFVTQSNLSIKAGDALIDPLVINFDGPSAALTTNKYSFDLDLDGKNDQISFANSGSGFLVYDKNADGIINDGNELFGPKSGNGFLELTKYDQDGNNWIDENDAIFDKLQIWTKDENGEDQLFAIGKKGVGAIYLGAVNTSFSLKDESNDTLGQIRQTGIFLREDGSAGTIQHIDVSL